MFNAEAEAVVFHEGVAKGVLPQAIQTFWLTTFIEDFGKWLSVAWGEVVYTVSPESSSTYYGSAWCTGVELWSFLNHSESSTIGLLGTDYGTDFRLFAPGTAVGDWWGRLTAFWVWLYTYNLRFYWRHDKKLPPFPDWCLLCNILGKTEWSF